MSSTESNPLYTDNWQQFLQLLQQAMTDNCQQELLQLLLTPDERLVLATRVKIIEELLKGQLSQRQLKDQLGVGIATITRGSNGLKTAPEAFIGWLSTHLLVE